MPLYFFKPVVWNENGYLRPGGAKFTSGYPFENGFGHEEWNLTDWSILKMVSVGGFLIPSSLETSHLQVTRGKYSFL